MREHGLVSSVHGLGANAHACWMYDDDGEARRAVLEFLAEGIELGQRLMCVGPASSDELRRWLDPLGGVDELIERDALRIAPAAEIYDPKDGSDPDGLLATYRRATDEALADGFRGLRVAAEVTALARDRSNWAAHTHWEACVDRYMAEHPLSALCLYDRRKLATRIAEDLAAVHPACCPYAGVPPFRAYSGDDRTILEGEIDRFSARSLRRVLPHVLGGKGPQVIDVSGVEFIDHHGLQALAAYTHELEGERVAVEGQSEHVGRLCELLEISLGEAETARNAGEIQTRGPSV